MELFQMIRARNQ